MFMARLPGDHSADTNWVGLYPWSYHDNILLGSDLDSDSDPLTYSDISSQSLPPCPKRPELSDISSVSEYHPEVSDISSVSTYRPDVSDISKADSQPELVEVILRLPSPPLVQEHDPFNVIDFDHVPPADLLAPVVVNQDEPDLLPHILDDLNNNNPDVNPEVIIEPPLNTNDVLLPYHDPENRIVPRMESYTVWSCH